jgi:hypothetical protein
MRLFVRTYKMNTHHQFNPKLCGRSSYRAGAQVQTTAALSRGTGHLDLVP